MKIVNIVAILVIAIALPAGAQEMEAQSSASLETSGSTVGLEVSSEVNSEVGTSSKKKDDTESPAPNTGRENACEAECRNEWGGSGTAGFDACIRRCGAERPASPARQSVEPQKSKSAQYGESELDFLRASAVAVSAVEVRGWDPEKKQEFLATVKTHAQVRSEQDLEHFATGVLLKDENIESVSLDIGEVNMEYRSQAKLFGFIPFSYKQKVVVTAGAEGSERVKVKFPWFRFLMKTGITAEELKAKVETALPEVGDEVLVGFESQAEIALTLSAILKASHETVKGILQNIR